MMRTTLLAAASTLLFFGGNVALDAGEVTISGVHLCCGACVKAVEGAFPDVKGVTNVSVDKDAGTVKFDADDEDAAKSGLKALAKAGFGGSAKMGDDELKFPTGNVKKDAKGDEVTVRGVHNCCGGCVKAIEAALKGVDGVTEVDVKKKVCTIKGSDVSHSALIEALH